ncbi:pyruvate/2-oxoglutarate dehydrogenase complex, dihydrolipoamide dehydrogenase component [Mycolicibacterium chubuense NBB4]|uniref:Pyruvate/2-oxoglutarate dehydrogenase complex, dihydrolipoamide dehydrogenase component n=1 Tax=Mycolicibacterium chubuense (strain NBB4) TaxID=710421 RepID=I4BD73_MYCCN|nr:mycothione reductase [Mycolicibacterium chubuense]AFM15230.1 pyruvate/2-oxoglutarate dehydrogenase complex, dihydrolipoamide dehydrogenase component [Mycolicibacterium chubuense NBB4]
MRTHDLVVIGAGSGNMVVDDRFADLDVAIVDDRKFGGTCVNYGCIPSKMLSYTAEIADTVANAGDLGIETGHHRMHWAAVRDRVFGRTDTVSDAGERGRRDSDFITVYDGHGRFTAPRALRVTGDGPDVEISAERVVVAAGSRPVIPAPIAKSTLPFETSDTVMRIDSPPRHLAVLGGGYIAAELAHVFSSVGSDITIIEKSGRLLGGPQDDALRTRYTDLMRSRYDIRCGTEVTELAGAPGDLEIRLDDGSVVRADTLLVAAGRRSNSDRLDVGKAGIDTHDDGRIAVDEYCRTSADGVFALGDVSTPVPLKHVANREAAVVKHNLLHPDDLRAVSHELVPSAVFTVPQMASIGVTENDCRDSGLDYRVGLAEYADVAYGWAMEDDTGLCKVLAEPDGTLLGAHILGAQAATLIHVFVVAMNFGIKADELANRPYWVHPALAEVVENALLALRKADS